MPVAKIADTDAGMDREVLSQRVAMAIFSKVQIVSAAA